MQRSSWPTMAGSWSGSSPPTRTSTPCVSATARGSRTSPSIPTAARRGSARRFSTPRRAGPGNAARPISSSTRAMTAMTPIASTSGRARAGPRAASPGSSSHSPRTSLYGRYGAHSGTFVGKAGEVLRYIAVGDETSHQENNMHRTRHFRGRHMSHRGRRGDVRGAVLALLAEEPMHGYEMIQRLEERTGGRWRPSAGSIYPTLQLLEDEGLVSSEEVDGRRVFSLTDDGRKAAEERGDGPAPWEGGEESSVGELRP